MTEAVAPAQASTNAAMTRAAWFVVQTQAQSESRVAQTIRDKTKQQHLEDKIIDVLVPSEQVVEVKGGRKKNIDRKFFPGYVLVKMVMSDEVWHEIKRIPKVTGILGAKDKPTPLSDREVERMLQQVKEGVEKTAPSVRFDVGEQVRVNDGPFTSFVGMVEEVDADKGKLKVMVSIFGRSTPVELDYTQVEKVGA